MSAEILVPLTFFGFLGAIILGPTIVRERTKRSAHELVSKALERGQTIDPALVAQMTQNMLDEGNRARKSLGNGVILLALAGGFMGAGFMIQNIDGDSDGLYGMGIPAVILAAVGAAYLLLAIFDYATKKRVAA
ncbi:MAG: hypothetical protein JNM59_00910 [Hyphomonadaceae bacterium]|nr:hypothetical protein [Hyphomonadaceae bacterium]